MGSRLSRVVQPRPRAEAAAAHDDMKHANAPHKRHDSAPRPSKLFSYDDIIVPSSTTLPLALQRRNSAPAPTLATAATPTTIERARELTAAFSLFYAEYCLMSIQLPDDEPNNVAVAVAPVPFPPLSQPPSDPAQECTTHCVICCAPLPVKTKPNSKREAIRPCRSCDSAFCPSCIRDMFLEACKDATRMPPRCCIPIQLRHATPLLTQEEARLFKAKYEEWMTPHPFYCPVPTCSAFIPERLLPDRTQTKGRRTDSAIGVPASTSFQCPTCKASICLDCRQAAHPYSTCNVSEFGIDQETTELLKSWGYKQCPKCRHGLKRMYGCNHMECRCGAHFCYVCMGDPEDCGGKCHEYDEDDDDDDDDESFSGSDDVHESDEIDTSAPSDPMSHAQGENQNNETRHASLAQSRNLDGGRGSYWMNQPLDFGEEPGQEYADRFWNCHHEFRTDQIYFEEALVRDPVDAPMECVKCWCTIYPEIKPPLSVSSKQAKTIFTGSRATSAITDRVIGRRHGHGRRRRQRVSLRSLSRADATMETSLYHSSTPSPPLSQSAPDHELSFKQDIDYSSDRVLDIYGNVVFSPRPERQRRASMDDYHMDALSEKGPIPKSSLLAPSTHSTVFATPSSKLSFAYECIECHLFVCASCKDALMAARDEAHREGY